MKQALKIAVALGILSSIPLSYPLWFASHSMGHWALVELPGIIPYLSLVFLTSSLVWTFLPAYSKQGFWGMAIAFALLCLLDFNFLQPFYYQYLLQAAALQLLKKKEQQIKAFFGLLALTYLWSGIHKFHPDFDRVFLRIFPETFTQLFSPESLQLLAYTVPAVEVLLGAVLLFRPKQWAVWVAIGMHLFIALNNSALHLNWNYIIIPWNLCIALQWGIFLAFGKTGKRKHLLHLLLLLPGLLPLGMYAFQFPNYLSFDLYSGRGTFAKIQVEPACYRKIPATAKSFCSFKQDGMELKWNQWYEAETGVFPHPSPRQYQWAIGHFNAQFGCKARLNSK